MTPTPTAKMPTASAMRPMSGMPRLRRIGVRTDSRPGAGARGRTFTGAGRPLDGGRGRTCVGRDPRRLVIGRIVARRSQRSIPMTDGRRLVRVSVSVSERGGALYSGAVARAVGARRRQEYECRPATHGPDAYQVAIDRVSRRAPRTPVRRRARWQRRRRDRRRSGGGSGGGRGPAAAAAHRRAPGVRRGAHRAGHAVAPGRTQRRAPCRPCRWARASASACRTCGATSARTST